MLVSEKLAIAAHLHVLLRRKTGRVTDTEWMAENLEYAREVVRFSRAKALEDGHAELAEWAAKLERAVLEGPGRHKPLVQNAVKMLSERVPAPSESVSDSGFGPSQLAGGDGFAASTLERPRKPKEADTPRYVGGIR